jgi:5'-3' exonuclease
MLLVIDGNNVAWAGFHALRRPMGADTPEKYVRAALLGLTQSVVGFAVRCGEAPEAGPPRRAGQSGMFDDSKEHVTRLVVAFDEGRPLRRRMLYPPYQTGRESDPNFMEFEKYVVQAIGEFSDLATAMPCEVLRGQNTEADDLISAAVLGSREQSVRICSTDRDFLQLVDEQISIYSPVKKLVITTENFGEATAPKSADGTPSPFPRERYLQYRVASGDASDNLPGIPGVGTLTAAKMLNAAPLHEYLDNPAKLTKVLGRRNARTEAAFASGEAALVIERNAQLMDLRAAAENYPDLSEYCTTGKWDESIFRAWVKEQRVSALEIESAVACLSRVAEDGRS